MAIALEQFVKQLADSGVIAPGKLEHYVPPKAQPKDAQELARQLIESKHLTKFQAQEIYQGRAKTLILGSYTILDKIGSGGMGQVFKAEHRRMKRIVAIKVLPKVMTDDAAATARFQREVEAAAKLSHPNIVAAFDADEAGGVHFLVMEYVEGSDLSAAVKKDGPLCVAKAVNYILQASRGLELAHSQGVVHRDIKPANLVLDKMGTVKILDLGLARIDAGRDAATQAELTGTGAVMGTVDYMAPEQALSTKHVDARADIYSLGCSLHYLLTGKATYDGDTLMAKLLAHREMAIPSLGDHVPEQLQTVFNKMVAKKVEERYQTISEVTVALESCTAGPPTPVGVRQSVTTSVENDTLAFIRDTPGQTTHKSRPLRKVAATKTGNGRKKIILSAACAVFLGLAILAGILFKVPTKDGTLIVEVNQPDATVEVLNEAGKVEIKRPGEKGSLSISVDPGKHRLKVEKEGFRSFAKDFEMESGGTRSITVTLAPVKVVAEPTLNPWITPAFQQWMSQVAALPAEQQVEAVIQRLKELNLNFDGKETHKIDDGIVTQLEFGTDDLIDISPVRALVGLSTLDCRGGKQEKSVFSDLSPLRGLLLTKLICNNTRVSDLSPLHEMPLAYLDCHNTQVTSLQPLKGMPLTHFDCYTTQVKDLSPLQGMHLAFLHCDNTQVTDLTPLQGMPVTSLSCFNTRVSDISPLKGMPLTELHIHQTSVSDLSPLEGMKLTDVWFTPAKITNGIELIRRMDSLKTIGIGWEGKKQFVPAEFWIKYDAGEFGEAARK